MMRLSVVLDGLENISLGKKSVFSTEQKKARLVLIQEISKLLEDAKREVAVATSTESEVMTNIETPIKDLLARTKTLINTLQADET